MVSGHIRPFLCLREVAWLSYFKIFLCYNNLDLRSYNNRNCLLIFLFLIDPNIQSTDFIYLLSLKCNSPVLISKKDHIFKGNIYHFYMLCLLFRKEYANCKFHKKNTQINFEYKGSSFLRTGLMFFIKRDTWPSFIFLQTRS